jgi:phospholipase C
LGGSTRRLFRKKLIKGELPRVHWVMNRMLKKKHDLMK